MDNSSSTDSVSVDVDGCSPWGSQDCSVPTTFGSISVQIYGDQGKPVLITYPDVGLNSATCFQNFFSCPEASSLMLHNFCIFHINPPGHEQGACQIPDHQPAYGGVDDLADQVVEVLDYFGLHEVIGLGVTAGAYILTHLAMKYSTRILGLILVSPICQAPSWSEWLYNKALVNLLYFWGMTNIVKEVLLQRYFGPAARLSNQMELYRRVLDSMEPCNVMRFMQAIHERKDLTPGLSKLKCRTLIIAGEQSPFHSEAHHASNAMDRRYNAVIETLRLGDVCAKAGFLSLSKKNFAVGQRKKSFYKATVHAFWNRVPSCGSLVTEEQPHSMVVPLEYFLMGWGFFRPTNYFTQSTATSPISPPCISSDLLSPESLGLKLKPIKTRLTLAEECC